MISFITMETSYVRTSKELHEIIQELELILANNRDAWNRQQAMERLQNLSSLDNRLPKSNEQQPWTIFKLGLFSGAFIILIVIVVLMALFNEYNTTDVIFIYHLYRAPIAIIEFTFLIGLNIYGWRRSGINYILIFELNPRKCSTELDLMELAAMLGFFWALSVLCFMYNEFLGIPPFSSPAMITGFMLVFMFNPLRVMRHDARFWLIQITFRIFLAPFFKVNFADSWLADQFNSLAFIFLDYHIFIYYYLEGESSIRSVRSYIVRPLLLCLPSWFRFAQCCRQYWETKSAFPHLVNAGKYATIFLVAFTGSLHNYYDDYYLSTFDSPYTWIWLSSSLLSAIYTSLWDVKMDWGLFEKKPGENMFLRKEIIYPKIYYYFAIVENFIIRFVWIIAFYVNEIVELNTNGVMKSIVINLELFRRFIWNFFRLENEHIKVVSQDDSLT